LINIIGIIIVIIIIIIVIVVVIMAYMNPAKMAEPIKMPFRGPAGVGARNHLLDGVHINATW